MQPQEKYQQARSLMDEAFAESEQGRVAAEDKVGRMKSAYAAFVAELSDATDDASATSSAQPSPSQTQSAGRHRATNLPPAQQPSQAKTPSSDEASDPDDQLRQRAEKLASDGMPSELLAPALGVSQERLEQLFGFKPNEQVTNEKFHTAYGKKLVEHDNDIAALKRDVDGLKVDTSQRGNPVPLVRGSTVHEEPVSDTPHTEESDKPAKPSRGKRFLGWLGQSLTAMPPSPHSHSQK